MTTLWQLLVAARPSRLAIWVAVQVAAASAVLLAVAVTTPIDHGIALSWPGMPPDAAVSAGLTFWLAFGLIGGVRTRLQPGGGIVTFSMPFVVAGTVLGGPLAGGLMGLVSELEVRELRTRPWYGILSNHAVVILAAVGAGLVATSLESELRLLAPGQDMLVLFVVVMVAALVFTTLNVALLIPTLAIRNGLTIREASRTPDAAFRATAVAESILAWNLAMSYLLVGWWAPILIVALVLAVWQAFDRGERLGHDPLTGLLNDFGFEPRLDAAIRKAELGIRPYALLSLDLDGLWEINLDYGSSAGDTFLCAAAQKMLRAVRATDAVARKANTGDEFLVLLDDIPDIESARRVAERIRAVVREPIHVRGRGGSELLHGDISIGIVLIERRTTLSATELKELAERRLQKAKAIGAGIVSQGNGPTPRQLQAYRDRKAEQRNQDAGGRRGRDGPNQPRLTATASEPR